MRKRKKEFKELFIELLSYDIEKFTTNDDILEKLAEINPLFSSKIDVKTVIAAQVIKRAINGDLTAISMLKTQIGEAPIQEINQTNTNINITDEKIINAVLKKVKDL